MRWGTRRWGRAAWGGPLATDLRAEALPGLPPSALVRWTPRAGAPASTVWQLYVNGRLYATTADTSWVVTLEDTGRFWFEVFGVNPRYDTDDLSRELEALSAIPGDRVRLSWDTGPKWGRFKWGGSPWGKLSKDEAVSFRIYWDAGAGGGLTLLDEVSTLYWTSDVLEDGTYVFRVDPVDAAGNQRESSETISVAILRMPDPPSGLTLVGAVPTGPSVTFGATWTASPTSGVTSYKVYSNHGSGPIDYSAPVKTVSTAAAAWSETGVAGAWAIAVRAVKGGIEEDNVHVRYDFELAGSPLALLEDPPATPINLVATAIAGGAIRLQLDYPAVAEVSAKAETVNVYGDGGTGTVDYTSPLLTIAVPEHDLGRGVFALLGETAALSDATTYTFAARASTSGGRESTSSEEASATADATAPGEVVALSGAATIVVPLLSGDSGA